MTAPQSNFDVRLDPDPLTVDAESPAWWKPPYDRGYMVGFSEGYSQGKERRRLSIVPFMWGLVGGAAVALIIALAILGTGPR